MSDSEIHEIDEIHDIAEQPIDVLVVENDHDGREMLTTLLRINACVVRTAQDGVAAMPLVLARRPDVMVIDLNVLDGPVGWAFATALRSDPRTREIALVAVTGGVEPQPDVVRPFDAYLRKPFETGLLIDLIRELTDAVRPRAMTRSA